MIDPATSSVLIGDPQRPDCPLNVLPRMGEMAEGEADASVHTERLERWVGDQAELTQFISGLAYGLGLGAIDLVVGTGKLWFNAVDYLGNETAQGLNHIQLWFVDSFGKESTRERVRMQIELQGGDLKARRQLLHDTFIALKDLRAWVREAENDLLISIFLRPLGPSVTGQANHRLAEKNQQILELWSMLSEHITTSWENARAYDKGRYTGIVIFEIASSFITVSKLAKVTKAKWLLELSTRKVKVPGWENFADEAAVLATKFRTTKMCFAAGTLVLSRVDGIEQHRAIEELEILAHNGSQIEAWARDEESGQEGWKTILTYFTTHPNELVHLSYQNSSGQHEQLTGTAEHPFYVLNRKEPAFVPMGELQIGDSLFLANGQQTQVKGLTRERAPPNQTFTTYNFEVQDFHTYFVGKSGVWVHNTGRAPCEKVFAIYSRYRNRGLDPWEAFEETVRRTPGVPSRTYGLAAGDAMDELYRLKAAGENVSIPTHTQVRELMIGRNLEYSPTLIPEGSFFATLQPDEAASLFRRLRLESHHTAPRKFQEWLGIPEEKWNDAPAYLTTFL